MSTVTHFGIFWVHTRYFRCLVNNKQAVWWEIRVGIRESLRSYRQESLGTTSGTVLTKRFSNDYNITVVTLCIQVEKLTPTYVLGPAHKPINFGTHPSQQRQMRVE